MSSTRSSAKAAPSTASAVKRVATQTSLVDLSTTRPQTISSALPPAMPPFAMSPVPTSTAPENVRCLLSLPCSFCRRFLLWHNFHRASAACLVQFAEDLSESPHTTRGFIFFLNGEGTRTDVARDHLNHQTPPPLLLSQHKPQTSHMAMRNNLSEAWAVPLAETRGSAPGVLCACVPPTATTATETTAREAEKKKTNHRRSLLSGVFEKTQEV